VADSSAKGFALFLGPDRFCSSGAEVFELFENWKQLSARVWKRFRSCATSNGQEVTLMLFRRDSHSKIHMLQTETLQTGDAHF
jgi:hypothetical protein